MKLEEKIQECINAYPSSTDNLYEHMEENDDTTICHAEFCDDYDDDEPFVRTKCVTRFWAWSENYVYFMALNPAWGENYYELQSIPLRSGLCNPSTIR